MLGPDLVTLMMQAHLEQNGQLLAVLCANWASSAAVPVPTPTSMSKVESAAAHNTLILQALEDICGKLQFFPALILSRKIPLEVLGKLTAVAQLPMDKGIYFSWQMETVLFATNCLMRWARHDDPVDTPRRRNFLRPTPSELDDVVRLMILAGFHVLNSMYLNHEMRRSLSASDEFDTMIRSYNGRQSADGRKPISRNASGVMVMVPAQQLPFSPVMRVEYPGGRAQDVRLWNYYPILADASESANHVRFLERPFPARDDLSFEAAWNSWLGMNSLAMSRLPSWIPGTPFQCAKPAQRLFVEIMFDVCETGLDGSSLAGLVEDGFHALELRKWPGLPSHEVFRHFVEAITFDESKRSDFEASFIEVPYAIYRVGPKAILWDHLRSFGTFKAIGRRGLRGGGAAGKRKGNAFESTVAGKLEERAYKVERNVKVLENGRCVIEIDVACLYHDVWVLIECKANLKAMSYYRADGWVVARRTETMNTYLYDRDDRLRKYAQEIRMRLSAEPGIGALWVVCTSEVEYIPSANASLWLKPFEVPRICTPEELCKLLETASAEEFKRHPSFVQLFDQ